MPTIISYKKKSSRIYDSCVCFEDSVEGLLLSLAEAFFPLVALVGAREICVWGCTSSAFFAASSWGAVRVGRWLASTPAACCPDFATEVLLCRTRSFLHSNKSAVSAFALSCCHGNLEFASWLVEHYEMKDTSFPIADVLSEAVVYSTLKKCKKALQWLSTTFSLGLTTGNKSEVTRWFVSRICGTTIVDVEVCRKLMGYSQNWIQDAQEFVLDALLLNEKQLQDANDRVRDANLKKMLELRDAARLEKPHFKTIKVLLTKHILLDCLINQIGGAAYRLAYRDWEKRHKSPNEK